MLQIDTFHNEDQLIHVWLLNIYFLVNLF